MNLSSAHQLRRLIPRWRRFSSIAFSPETASVQKRQQTDPDKDVFFQDHLLSWKIERSIENAVDLVCYGIIGGFTHHVVDAAAYLIDQGNKVSPAQRMLAKEIIDLIEKPNEPREKADSNLLRAGSLDEIAILVRKDIANTKRELAEWPRNPLMWVELSRLYSIVGQPRKAGRAMQTALGLSRNNRLVVRSAARLSVHLREPDRALEIIRGVSGFHRDPWLLASEIAISCILGKTSARAKQAITMLKSNQFSPEHITELAGAIGTLELTKGTERKARKLFRQSLIRPNDNSLAQAEWAASRIGNIDTKASLNVSNPYEALARHALAEANWIFAMQSAFRWAEDEPFSSGPSAVGSYVAAALLDDYETSLDFCELGVISNPEDLDIKNNKIVALIHLGRLEEAISLYRTIVNVNGNSDNVIVLTATSGLLAFRTGDAETGRMLYLKAAELASKRKNVRLKAMAGIYLAKEEIQAKSDQISQAIGRAERDYKGLENDKEVNQMMKLLQVEIGKIYK